MDGGLALRITVAAPRLPLSVTGVLDGGCLGAAQLTLGGDAGATALVLEGQAALGLDAAGAQAVSFPAFAATLEGLSLGVDVGALASWTGLGSALGDALTAAVRGAVQRAITGAVQGLVAGRAAAVLARLGGTRAVALPPELGGAVLLVDAALDGLVFDAAWGRLSLGIQLRPESPRPEHLAVGAPGAMRLGGTPPDLAARLAAAPDARIALAVQDDLLNQVLQAAWLAGAFDREFSPALGPALTGTRIALFAGLPPVVMPRAGGAPGVDLGWGEVAFTLGVAGPGGQLEARGTFSAILPVDHLAIGPAGLDLAFGDAVEAFVEVDDLNWGPGPEAREAAAGVLQGALRSLLPELLARAVRPVPLPRLDLHALDPALPDLALGLASPTLERDGRYAMLTAGIIAGPGAP